MGGSRSAVVHGLPGLTLPSGVDEFYGSIYRGTIENVNDDQMRKRMQVRVDGVHPDGLDTEFLPWAECACLATSSLAGDFFPFTKGDRVWVMFEGGDRNNPVVTGTWIARPAGLNDVPSDVTVDYARTQRRWVRVDRVGNTIEMSELPDEAHLRLISGAAEVVLDQKDGSLSLRSGSGSVRVEGSRAETDVVAYFVTAEQMILSAEAKTLGSQGILQLMADYEANIHALNPLTGSGVVRIGGYLPRYKGVPDPSAPFRQTPTVEVCGREVQIGSPTRTVLGHTVPETETTEVNGVEVLIRARAAVNLPSGATIRVLIDSDGVVTVSSTTQVHVQAPLVKIDAANVEINSTVDIRMT